MQVDREVDLLIAGAGPAGMTAALVASLEGLDVLICEKTDQVGGTGSTSAGTLWIPGNTQSKAAGFNDNPAEAERYLDALIPNPANRPLRTAFLETGPKAIDYLSEKTDVQFVPCGKHPDYRSNMPGAALTGRAIVPQAFDGRLLGSDFKRIRPPIPEFMLLGGMMVGKEDIPRMIGRFQSVANFVYAAKLVLRYFSDRLRYPRGTRIMMGNALIARLFYSLRKRNVPVLYNASIAGIDGDRNGVTGVRVTGGWQGDARAHPQGRRAGDRRLCAQQGVSRRLHAAAGASAFAQPQRQPRRWHRHRPKARRRASLRRIIFAADFGRLFLFSSARTAARGSTRTWRSTGRNRD